MIAASRWAKVRNEAKKEAERATAKQSAVNSLELSKRSEDCLDGSRVTVDQGFSLVPEDCGSGISSGNRYCR